MVNVELLKKHAYLVGLAVLGFLFFVSARLNFNRNDYGIYSDDEYHTVYQGINFYRTGKVDNFRAAEGVRWLTRLFYPYALISMTTRMGA